MKIKTRLHAIWSDFHFWYVLVSIFMSIVVSECVCVMYNIWLGERFLAYHIKQLPSMLKCHTNIHSFIHYFFSMYREREREIVECRCVLRFFFSSNLLFVSVIPAFARTHICYHNQYNGNYRIEKFALRNECDMWTRMR